MTKDSVRLSKPDLVIEPDTQKYRDSMARVTRLVSFTAIGIHTIFILDDLVNNPDIFWQLFFIKILIAVPILGIAFLTYFERCKQYCECLLIAVLIMIMGSAFWHSSLLTESTFIPISTVFCTTFSASIIPWKPRWHISVVLLCIVAVILNHMLLGSGVLWPLPKTHVISIVFCISSLVIMNYSLRQRLELADTTSKMRASEQQAHALAEQFGKLANTDFLTDAGNLRSFHDYADLLIADVQSGERSLCVILMDLDRFKEVNDQYGHAVGDDVLTQFVQLCRRQFRGECHVSRIGGEEFAVLVPDVGQDRAINLAESFRELLANTVMYTPDDKNITPLKVTVSIGISEVMMDETDVKRAIKRCDQALYLAKEAGRNKVVTWTASLT